MDDAEVRQFDTEARTLVENYIASRVGQVPVAVGALLAERHRLRSALISISAVPFEIEKVGGKRAHDLAMLALRRPT